MTTMLSPRGMINDKCCCSHGLGVSSFSTITRGHICFYEVISATTFDRNNSPRMIGQQMLGRRANLMYRKTATGPPRTIKFRPHTNQTPRRSLLLVYRLPWLGALHHETWSGGHDSVGATMLFVSAFIQRGTQGHSLCRWGNAFGWTTRILFRRTDVRTTAIEELT